jgi:hypothetical protein
MESMLGNDTAGIFVIAFRLYFTMQALILNSVYAHFSLSCKFALPFFIVFV